MSTLPRAVHNAVVEGLQRLYTLSLQGCPSAEVLPLTVATFIDALAAAPVQWQDDDAARVQQAVASLLGSLERWPTPRQLLAAMPPRAQAQALAHGYCKPSPRQRRALAQARASLFLRSPR